MICFLGAIYYSSLSIPGKHMCARATDQAGSLPGKYLPWNSHWSTRSCCWLLEEARNQPLRSPHCWAYPQKYQDLLPPREKHSEIWEKAVSINQHELSWGIGTPKACPCPKQGWMSPSREPGPGHTCHDLGAPAQPAPRIPGAAETFPSQLRSNHLFFKT